MATLRRDDSPERIQLRPRHILGRAETCATRLPHRSVSGEHAVISWSGDSWLLRDLGSRNGTFLDGRRLEPGESAVLGVGSRVHFARYLVVFVLEDPSAPVAMAVSLSSDAVEPLLATGDILQIPDEEPVVTVYRDALGSWLAESADGVRPIETHERFTVAGHPYQLFLPGDVARTAGEDEVPTIENIDLHFRVSRDEEHVSLEMGFRGRFISLGSRTFHYMLLLLARARAEDAARGEHKASAWGWRYRDELARMLAVDVLHLNTFIHRARRQLAGAGVLHAAQLVEVRSDTRQIRLGVERFTEVGV